MEFVERTRRWQRGLLAAIPVVSALGFWRASYDVFNTFKATTILVGAVAILAVGGLRVSRTRRASVPTGLVWAPVLALVAALLVATVTATNPVLALVGRIGRHTGLTMYLVYLAVFVAAARLYARSSPITLVKALLVAAGPVVGYGLLQAIGVEPLGWNVIEGGPQVFATFGNANFFSAWLGIVVPLALYGALTPRLTTPWRAACLVLGAGAVAAQLASNSLQGPLAAAAGSVLVLGVWLFSTEGVPARRRMLLLAAGASGIAVAAAVFLAGPGRLGPLRDQASASLLGRTAHWQTALGMARERPVTGFGLGSFGDWAYRFRPDWYALERGLDRSVDSAHSVPLEMLANGGVVLLGAYLAFVGLVVWAIVSGVRAQAGQERLLLGGLAGAWLAYHVQAALSIDVPPLAILHYLLAGIIVGRGLQPGWREVALPGAPRREAVRPGKKRKRAAVTVPLAPPSPAILGAVGLLAIAAVWVGTVPLRADLAAQEGRRLAAAGDTRNADRAYLRASSTAFWDGAYPALRAGLLNGLGRTEMARDAYREAAAREPRGLAHAMNLARLAVALDEPEEAERWYSTALGIDPKTPETLAEVGRWWVSRGRYEDALGLLERAASARENADWWVALGRARSASGDDDGATAAFRRALAIDPDAEDAEQALEELAVRT